MATGLKIAKNLGRTLSLSYRIRLISSASDAGRVRAFSTHYSRTTDHIEPFTRIRYHKKLKEVAQPLDEINAEPAREKSIRHGRSSTPWWAGRRLATSCMDDFVGSGLPEERA